MWPSAGRACNPPSRERSQRAPEPIESDGGRSASAHRMDRARRLRHARPHPRGPPRLQSRRLPRRRQRHPPPHVDLGARARHPPRSRQPRLRRHPRPPPPVSARRRARLDAPHRATALIPAGFFLGGIDFFGRRPRLGVLLVPSAASCSSPPSPSPRGQPANSLQASGSPSEASCFQPTRLAFR